MGTDKATHTVPTPHLSHTHTDHRVAPGGQRPAYLGEEPSVGAREWRPPEGRSHTNAHMCTSTCAQAQSQDLLSLARFIMTHQKKAEPFACFMSRHVTSRSCEVVTAAQCLRSLVRLMSAANLFWHQREGLLAREDVETFYSTTFWWCKTDAAIKTINVKWKNMKKKSVEKWNWIWLHE